jgi:magnesium transporter
MAAQARGVILRLESRMPMQNLFPPGATKPENALWVDLFNPTDDEIKAVATALSIDIPDRDSLEEIESSSRLQFENGVIQLSVPVSAHKDDEGPTSVGFLLTEKFLVTLRYTEMHAFAAAAHQCSKAHDPLTSSAAVFTTIMEGMVDYGADLLEQVAGELNRWSKDIFRRYGRERQRNVARVNKRMRETLVAIGLAGEKLSQVRDSILGLQRAVPYALDKSKNWIGPECVTRLKTTVTDSQSLADFEVHLTDKVQFLLDAVLGFINTEQNDIFKVLTIASVVGIPPTFLASMWGMNFETIGEYHWRYGYAFALAMIGVSVILPIIWFKWRGWW